MNKTLYFVKPVGMDGPIKIGITGTLSKRLRELMRNSPVDLEVIAIVEGGSFQAERRLQRSLIQHHFRQEWFHAAPEVLAVVEAVKNGTFDFDALPADDRPLWYEHHLEQNRLVPRKGRKMSDDHRESMRLSHARRAAKKGLAA